MPKHKDVKSRIKFGKLPSSKRLTKTDQKKIKGGAFADGSVRALGDGSVKFIKDGTSNT